MGEEYDRIRRNKRHKYKSNEYIEGYVPGKQIREVVELEGDIVISNPIIVNQVVRPQGVQIIQNLQSQVTTTNGDFASDDQVYRIPTPGTYFIIILNGRVIQPAKDVSEISTAAAYFVSPEGALRPQGEIEIGDKLKWNGANAGVQIQADDELLIIYEVTEA